MEKEERDEKKEMKKEMREEKHMMFHRRNWLRHNAMVPKGFLRYHVLEALNEHPMSGSELMDQIGKHTDGAWKPSPGSIYPLLAYLQDNAYVKELPTENGFKRYELTQSGKELLIEQANIREKFTLDGGFMTHPFFDRFFGDIPQEKSRQIHASVHASMEHLFRALLELSKTLSENYTEKELDEALKALDDASAKIEEIRNKIKGKTMRENKGK